MLLAWGIGPEIRGVVEVFSYPSAAAARPEVIEAEIALVVARGFRGLGIGPLLLVGGIAAAARCGVVWSTMLLSARDHALPRMARRLGFRLAAGGDRMVLAHPDDSGGS